MNEGQVARLLATVLVLASTATAACGKKQDAPSAPSASAAPSSSSAPAKPVVDITQTCVESARASSEQKDHPALQAFDEDPKTAWNDQAPDGKNEWVEARLRSGTFVDHVEVSGGWASMADNGKTDLWMLNSSFRTMKVSWDGGSKEVTFDRASDRGTKKSVAIGAVASFVRFTAVDVDRGKYKDLCLDDAIVYGSCPPECEGATSTCSDTLFVQLAIPQSSAPPAYDYPLTRKMVLGHPELVGMRIVETQRDGKRVMGAIVSNQCVADKLLTLARDWGSIQPSASCGTLAVAREVWTVDATMAASKREVPPASSAALDARAAQFKTETKAETVDRKHVGLFDVLFARIKEVMGDPNTYDQPALVITPAGEIRTEGTDVLGQADIDGDGRPDLVLSVRTPGQTDTFYDFNVVANRAAGPARLVPPEFPPCGVREGSMLITQRNGKAALAVESRGSCEHVGEGTVSAPIEVLTVQWDGSKLAVVSRSAAPSVPSKPGTAPRP